jgi:hypothetical protein
MPLLDAPHHCIQTGVYIYAPEPGSRRGFQMQVGNLDNLQRGNREGGGHKGDSLKGRKMR